MLINAGRGLVLAAALEVQAASAAAISGGSGDVMSWHGPWRSFFTLYVCFQRISSRLIIPTLRHHLYPDQVNIYLVGRR